MSATYQLLSACGPCFQPCAAHRGRLAKRERCGPLAPQPGGRRFDALVLATKQKPTHVHADPTLPLGATHRSRQLCQKTFQTSVQPLRLTRLHSPQRRRILTKFVIEAGARLIVLDLNDDRLAFCRRTLGAAHTVNGAREHPLGALQALTEGDLPTAVFDATGSARSMAAAFDYPAPGGRLAFVGLFQGDVSFNDPNFHRRELTLLASRNALPADFGRLIGQVEAGRIDTTPWITHRAPFAEALERFPAWVQPETGVIKAMIEL